MLWKKSDYVVLIIYQNKTLKNLLLNNKSEEFILANFLFQSMQLVARLTKDIVETYQICNPAFKYSEALYRKRFLTNPSVGVLNDGCDNANSDLILTVNFVLLNSDTKQRFGSCSSVIIVLHLLQLIVFFHSIAKILHKNVFFQKIWDWCWNLNLAFQIIFIVFGIPFISMYLTNSI